ncbi:MAG: methionine--tRNA ligase [Candidatus Eisenbacteria bacterium]|uniref:Methionine--tRNA ligase n=1 Tax=Eiseniibacteriota bacterium TaxID=2212470 RepID=A0A956NBS8_UNCEI|nr:methionine--tRNA ligase [Candidatus Eisenbacteria bacterium]
MARRFLVTSGLPYSNGRLHVGHLAGAYLPADIFVRYLRSKGEDVLFVCGSDDNGVASLMSARKEGVPVQDLVTRYNAFQKEDFSRVGVEFDVYGGTHHPDFVEMHERISQGFFRSIHEKGFFEKKTSKQLYDVEAKQFLPDRYVEGTCPNCGNPDAHGDQCDRCGSTYDQIELIDPKSTVTGTTPELRETTHWYLRLGEFETPLREWLEAKREPHGDQPAWRDTVLNFALGQIKQGLPERAMTRDLHWGVPVPLDDPDAEGKVLYVWFDAPIGYVSFTAQHCADHGGDWKEYERWWKDSETRIVHFIGEDNTVFHALTWPAMMQAEGSYQLPAQVVANSFLNVKLGDTEEKFSKSRGNAVWLGEFLNEFDPDPLRYYLTAIAPESARTAFDLADLVQRNNSELLGALGNYVNRTLTFLQRFYEGVVPELGERDERDLAQLARVAETQASMEKNLDAYRFKAALGDLMALARETNAYFNDKEPWKVRKTDPAAGGTILNVCAQTVKGLAVLMAPFLPYSAEVTREMLALPEGSLRWQDATVELPSGHVLGEPRLLFRQYELSEEQPTD